MKGRARFSAVSYVVGVLVPLLMVPALVMACDGSAAVFDAQWLHSQLPRELPGYERASQAVQSYESPCLIEVSSVFQGSDASTVNIFLGDLVQEPELLKEFLKARGLGQVLRSDSNAITADVVANTTVQVAQAVTVEQGSPTPEQASFTALTESGSPALALSDNVQLDLSQSSGAGILATASPTQAVVAMVSQESIGAAPLAIKASEVEVTEESRVVAVAPVSFQASTTDPAAASFITPYLSLAYDIAGWRVYDAGSKAGVLVLVIGNRFALLVEGAGIPSVDVLDPIVDQINIPALEAAAR